MCDTRCRCQGELLTISNPPFEQRFLVRQVVIIISYLLLFINRRSLYSDQCGMIATKPANVTAKTDTIQRFTHCEIRPITIFGVGRSY